MNVLVRLYHDKADLAEYDSAEEALKAYTEETGLRDRVVVIGIALDDGNLAARVFQNRRPGRPLPGALVQFVGGVAAMEFAEDSTAMLDRLNALPRIEGEACLILGNGATFHRSLEPVTLDLGLEDGDPALTAAPEGTTVEGATSEGTDPSAPEAPAEGAQDDQVDPLAEADSTTVEGATSEGTDPSAPEAPAEGTEDTQVDLLTEAEGTTIEGATSEGTDPSAPEAPAEGTQDTQVDLLAEADSTTGDGASDDEAPITSAPAPAAKKRGR